MALLDIKNLSIHFGGLVAVDDFNLSLEKNELVGLIGPNGAGKTTVFNMLTGVYLPTSGEIEIDGKSVVGKKPYDIVAIGAARTFQNIRLFNDLTVLDNIRIAYNGSQSYSLIAGVLRLPKYWKEEKIATEECLKLLSVFDLDKYAKIKAENLPYGQQRKLEIARALATNPKVLLLDEPAAGMNPSETTELMETIKFVKNKFDMTILLIEHDMHLVMNICERIIVIDYGKTIAKGLPNEIKTNPEVIKAYLGE
jgi:branched-chain amino acid transport system ATP-binding protein